MKNLCARTSPMATLPLLPKTVLEESADLSAPQVTEIEGPFHPVLKLPGAEPRIFRPPLLRRPI